MDALDDSEFINISGDSARVEVNVKPIKECLSLTPKAFAQASRRRPTLVSTPSTPTSLPKSGDSCSKTPFPLLRNPWHGLGLSVGLDEDNLGKGGSKPEAWCQSKEEEIPEIIDVDKDDLGELDGAVKTSALPKFRIGEKGKGGISPPNQGPPSQNGFVHELAQRRPAALATAELLRIGQAYASFEEAQNAVYQQENRQGYIWVKHQTKKKLDGSIQRITLRCQAARVGKSNRSKACDPSQSRYVLCTSLAPN